VTTFVALHDQAYVGQFDVTNRAREISFGPIEIEMQESTTFADGGYRTFAPGLIGGSGSINGFQDFGSGEIGSEFDTGAIGSQYPITVVPCPTGTVTAGDTALFSRGIATPGNPLGGAKGEMATFELGFTYDTTIVDGKVLHAKTARTSTGTGTAVALAGPSATQKLWAALHVTAYSGFTNVVVKVQSDDSGAFSSATDRITFTTVTGLTSQFASVDGSFSSESHLRTSWTVTGSGSITFVVVVGVL
jgi:hypothetical protein